MKKTGSWKIWLTGLVILAAAGGAYFWISKREPDAAERYKMQAVETGDIKQTVSANGTLNPVKIVSVGTQVSGTVDKLYVDFNDKVSAGQVLMKLNPSLILAQSEQSRANLVSAQSSLRLAQAEEARMRNLYKQEFVSRQDLDRAVQAREAAQAQISGAQGQVRRDQINLSYTVIRSPVSGIVISREVDVGQTVAASFQTPTLFKIAQDLRKMQIDSSIAEADVGNIKAGQTVQFSVDAFPDRQFSGRVKQLRLNPVTLQNVVTYNVVVEVDNEEEILLPGMTANINVAINQSQNALLVPNAALRFKPPRGENKDRTARNARRTAGNANASESPNRESGRTRADRGAEEGATRTRAANSATVYILEGEKLKPVRIHTGISNSKFTEVLTGNLKPGDAVVVSDTQAQTPAAAPTGGRSGGPRMRMF